MTAPLPDWFDPAQTERLLREKYAPILSAGDHALLREKCGLGEVIDGEVARPLPAIGHAGQCGNPTCPCMGGTADTGAARHVHVCPEDTWCGCE